ncbi:T9SS type A sorting domain-containing protein [Psychroserpens luteolus]|uniref:T9SS type A sorting domain-containing protein n=1 Tax=Psychroserpens luteolus TaxID=2855840 RepID=UPI001E46A542|nr:T9SS type A sorting domain-containing protein [Psychroserpens luteolus]MCD2258689.1 T9SS type A sorting domain-containing protein [Psychroserpens luteolus]
MKPTFLLLLFSLLTYSTNAQITQDNTALSGLVPSDSPVAITVPTGNNKALIMVISDASSAQISDIQNFNGLPVYSLNDSSSETKVFIVYLGDVTTEFVADLNFSKGINTVFTLNNVEQTIDDTKLNDFENIIGQKPVFMHLGSLNKEPGDFVINGFEISNSLGGECTQPEFSVFNSHGNTVNLEFEQSTGVGSGLQWTIYSSIVSNSNEFTIWSLADNCFDDTTGRYADDFRYYAVRHYSIIIKSVPAQTLTVIEDENEQDFKVFPNPAHTILNFNRELTGIYKVVDILGKVVIEKHTSNTYKNIDVTHLSSGTYVLKFTTENSTVIEHKFIKN